MRFHDIRRSPRGGARPGRARKVRRAGAPGLESLEGRVVLATTSTWSGAVSNLWSVAGNWNTLPAPGDDLVFPAAAANKTNVDDLAVGTSFSSLTFDGTGYAISGNAATIPTINDTAASGSDRLDLPLGDGPIVDVLNAAATLTLGGAITGTAPIRVTGSGTVVLSGANAVDTTISGGTALVDGNSAASHVTVSAPAITPGGVGALLGGTGTVASISADRGTISPGDNAPGILTDAGALTLTANSIFTTAIDGTTAGTGYGQLQAAGPINLGGAKLTIVLGSTPASNQQYTILKNTGASPITGQFAGLPQGSDLTVSGQTFQISYSGGSSAHDVVLTHLVTTATGLSVSNTAPNFGQQVLLTATVTAPGGGGPPSSGSVEFLNGTTDLGTVLINSVGIGTLDVSDLPAGVASVTVKYLGNGGFAPSTSAATTVNVAKAPTTTALTVTPTTSVAGQSVALKATVTPVQAGLGTPTGNVEFLSGSTEIQTVALGAGGTVTLNTTSLPVGTDSITAIYESDNSFATSTSKPVVATVTAIPTTTTLAVAPPSPALGQSVTLTATVAAQGASAGKPTGSVTFTDGSTTLGSAALNAAGVATLTTAALHGGQNLLTASYPGAGNFATSASATRTITIAQAASRTALAVQPDSSVAGQSVTLTAAVTGINAGSVAPTGNVQFFSGTTALGAANLSGGAAVLTTTALPVGTDSVTAVYGGDVNFTTSTSPAVATVVTQAATRVTVVTTIANPGPTQTEVFNVNVAPGLSGVTPTGTVDVFADGSLLGTATLSGGAGSVTVKDLPLGNLAITAVYNGDASNAASISTTSTLAVGTPLEQYINAIYLNVLGRPVDAGTLLTINDGGLAGWLTKFLQHNLSKRFLSTKIVHSKEPRQLGVQATYKNVAGKASTPPQQQNAFLGTNGTTVNLYSRVFGGPAYFAAAGSSTEGFLAALGDDILGTPLPAGFQAKFTAELNHGVPRSTVVHQLLTSNTGKVALVEGLYQRLLSRAADPSGLRTNVGVLNSGQSTDQVVVNLISSGEFYVKSTGTTSL